MCLCYGTDWLNAELHESNCNKLKIGKKILACTAI
jgi:hypothetical protein